MTEPSREKISLDQFRKLADRINPKQVGNTALASALNQLLNSSVTDGAFANFVPTSGETGNTTETTEDNLILNNQ